MVFLLPSSDVIYRHCCGIDLQVDSEIALKIRMLMCFGTKVYRSSLTRVTIEIDMMDAGL